MPDETTTRPALVHAEWFTTEIDRPHLHAYLADDGLLVARTPGDRSVLASGPDRHALAALALYGTPEGFSRQDVEDERETATVFDFIVATTQMPPARVRAMQQQAERHRARADRIAALLPE